jgi:hypothetical protein
MDRRRLGATSAKSPDKRRTKTCELETTGLVRPDPVHGLHIAGHGLPLEIPEGIRKAAQVTRRGRIGFLLDRVLINFL